MRGRAVHGRWMALSDEAAYRMELIITIISSFSQAQKTYFEESSVKMVIVRKTMEIDIPMYDMYVSTAVNV